ncbi:MAG TPA: hypothetical protein VK256_02270 [Candidatus Eisenbacteria bacterium]|nr:hypothetical protein [Candidatus Eisenbacteria bacterium]
MSVESGDGFDRWLEQQLQNEAAKAGGPSPVPAQAQYHVAYLQGGLHMSVLAKAVALVSTKAAIGIAVAVVAVGAAAVATEAAVTGSANPGNWGQQVVQQVDKCKAALAPGSHGIGECVSTFAKQHGPAVSSEHRASEAREHRATDAREHNPGQPPSHPTGKPTNRPSGPPNGVPPAS